MRGAGETGIRPSGQAERGGAAAQRPDTLSRPRVLSGTEEGLIREAARPSGAPAERVDADRADSFVVEEVETAAKTSSEPAIRFEIGYRVQVAATADRAAADRVRAAAEREAGLAAYIDSEEGLFKVRVGDFADRKAAGLLRAKLAARYPGCWIVRTAIRIERPSPGKGD